MKNRSNKLDIIIEVSTRLAFTLRNQIKLAKSISINEFENYLRIITCYLTLIVIVNLYKFEKILNIKKNNT